MRALAPAKPSFLDKLNSGLFPQPVQAHRKPLATLRPSELVVRWNPASRLLTKSSQTVWQRSSPILNGIFHRAGAALESSAI